ncbi:MULTISPECIES: hypothetical protein [Brevibacillus]|nr:MULTISPECIES: hypothetical protein [Brevibacillus]MED1948352.1 hypothetical protein [Brevibacillus formosus]MED1997917.1 hypothetical protein [Brevibacillus formosus]MED2080458.1 hypothetical protein [Brevibacillus formosus]
MGFRSWISVALQLMMATALLVGCSQPAATPDSAASSGANGVTLKMVESITSPQ